MGFRKVPESQIVLNANVPRQSGKNSLVRLIDYSQSIKPTEFGVPEICDFFDTHGMLDEAWMLLEMACRQGYIREVGPGRFVGE